MNLNFGRLPWYGQLGAFAALAAVGVTAFWYQRGDRPFLAKRALPQPAIRVLVELDQRPPHVSMISCGHPVDSVF